MPVTHLAISNLSRYFAMKIMQASLANIILIDNDKSLIDFLCLNLRSEGYSVEVEPYSTNIDPAILSDTQLVIIDNNENAGDGINIIQQIKSSAAGRKLGVIYCSVFDDEHTLIDALDAGADDCVRKPFSLRELLARIRAILRRRHIDSTPEPPALINFKNMSVDTSLKLVSIDGETVNLTSTEYAILLILLRNIGSYTSRQDIFHAVWHDSGSSNDRIVDTNISRLRHKLGILASKLVNRTGLGYMLSE